MGSISKHNSVTSVWTHREYFRRFSLNVEQYGEILIAQVFGGTKKGDTQPCYDVETTEDNIRHRLQDAGISQETVERCLSGLKEGVARIEVKSKLVETPTGRANVIHCSDNKIDGVGTNHPAATHFAVILFGVKERQGLAEHAWLFSNEMARDELRKMETKSRYIPVSRLKGTSRNGIINISSLVNEAASRKLGPEETMTPVCVVQCPIQRNS